MINTMIPIINRPLIKCSNSLFPSASDGNYLNPLHCWMVPAMILPCHADTILSVLFYVLRSARLRSLFHKPSSFVLKQINFFPADPQRVADAEATAFKRGARHIRHHYCSIMIILTSRLRPYSIAMELIRFWSYSESIQL